MNLPPVITIDSAAINAVARYETNKHVETFDGSFWKTCAWAMADDLKRALKPRCEHGVSVENPCWQCDEERYDERVFLCR